jgi:hypothetical protein
MALLRLAEGAVTEEVTERLEPDEDSEGGWVITDVTRKRKKDAPDRAALALLLSKEEDVSHLLDDDDGSATLQILKDAIAVLEGKT